MYSVDTKELRKAMIDSGFKTIDSLAKASNVSNATISAILNGHSYPSSAIIMKLGNALRLDADGIARTFFAQNLAKNERCEAEEAHVI